MLYRKMAVLYYLSPSVSMFKGNGEPQIGSYLDMPDNSAAGDVWNPPDTESAEGFNYDNCEAEAHGGRRGMAAPMMYLIR